jgi:hypothetical protein
MSERQKCDGCVETAETTNSPPWGDIKKNKENFPKKSQFIVQRGEKREGWKLPYKVKSGKIHCGGVRAASAAAAGARSGKPMSLSSAERRRLNSARKACKIGEATDGISQEMNLTLSTGKAGKFECLDDRSDDTKRVMRFELMDNAELYNGVRFTKEALQHQLDIFNEGEFLVTHGMDHSGRIRDQLGKVIEMELVEDGDLATIFITSEHYKETPAQIDAETLFNQGLLDSISGGWRASIAYNSDTEEYEVYKPKLREVSSTPIPAKTSAKTIENVCMDISVGLLLNQTPLEELDMTEEENQDPQEPSQPEGVEEQSANDTALNERQDAIEQEFADIKAKTVAQERSGLLERAAELGLAETDFEGVDNATIEKSLEVANKVKMSTLRGSDPDIPLGGDGSPIEDDGPEMREYLSKHIYRSDIMRD